MKERGRRLKQGETKRTIIRYLMLHQGQTEASLRKHIEDKLDIGEKKNIKKQLNDLLKMGCLKKHVRSGKDNCWAIENIDHVYCILKNFPELNHDLRRSHKIRNFLVEKHQQLIQEPDAAKLFKTTLKVSPTFFMVCIKYPSETLLEIARKLMESKWMESMKVSEPIHTQVFMESDEKLLLPTLFRASMIADFMNNFDHDEKGIPRYISIEDIDELNFLSSNPALDFTVKLVEESKD